MTQQTIYIVVNEYDCESPAFVQAYNNRAAADQHAAHLNKHIGYDEDESVFAVWEEAVLSEFNP